MFRDNFILLGGFLAASTSLSSQKTGFPGFRYRSIRRSKAAYEPASAGPSNPSHASGKDCALAHSKKTLDALAAKARNVYFLNTLQYTKYVLNCLEAKAATVWHGAWFKHEYRVANKFFYRNPRSAPPAFQ